jgi:hypothetical protein
MKLRAFTIWLIAFCLASWTLAEVADARGGGRGGGGRGGGFSRGGGGNYGSIRNSARPSTRDISRPSQGSFSRPSQGGRTDRLPSNLSGLRNKGGLSSDQKQQIQDRTTNMSPEQKQRAKDWQSGRTTEQKQKAQDKVSNINPEQKQKVQDRAAERSPEQKQQFQDRMSNLTPEQKDDLRQKFENSGINPDDLPDREEAREDWQDYRDKSREDWQDWYEDEYHDYWDDHYHSSWWYGYPVSTVSFSFYINDNPPCQKTVVVNQSTGTTNYYYCDSTWYQPAYTSGNVKYVVTSPPSGAELAAIADPHRITVNGQDYYISNHVFYQKIKRAGQTLYVTVDAPPGAKVPTIPQYAVAIEHGGQTYYRFDKIYYQRQGKVFIIVANPGV